MRKGYPKSAKAMPKWMEQIAKTRLDNEWLLIQNTEKCINRGQNGVPGEAQGPVLEACALEWSPGIQNVRFLTTKGVPRAPKWRQN